MGTETTKTTDELKKTLQQHVDEARRSSKEAVASWSQRRELEKLQSRADRAQEYAVNTIIVAMLDADEAEDAVLDAFTARIDAAAAASP